MFEEENKAISVTSARYVQMLQSFLKQKLQDIEKNATVWFQQDGATADYCKKSIYVLRELFPAHLISLRANIGWPARSPDLSPSDYFLRGYVKAEIYKH